MNLIRGGGGGAHIYEKKKLIKKKVNVIRKKKSVSFGNIRKISFKKLPEFFHY